MDFAITKMSSKGQVVIPQEMRKGLRKGDKLLIIQDDDKLIMKKASKLSENLEEDFEFAKRTEEAWKRFERGEFISMPADKFLKKLSKC